MKRTLVAVALVVIFTLALALPVAAFEHEATYKWEGTIDFSQQAGHFCNTGAEMQQRITGQGSMTKAKSVYMEEGVITVSDSNDWVTAPNAIRNLTVTTAIKLCAPAKHEYEGVAYNPDWAGGSADLLDVVNNNVLGFGEAFEDLYNLETDSHPYLSSEDALTKQIWAVQVAADPGFSGQIDMGFSAAYSGNVWPGELVEDDLMDILEIDEYNALWFELFSDDWAKPVPEYGPWFVGNYFAIEQFSRTSQGTHRRYIDISSPWSHALMSQNMTVRGMSEVWESFSMGNLPKGEQTGMSWWDLF